MPPGPTTMQVDTTWTPAAVIAVASIIIGLIATTLVPSIIALIKASRADARSAAADQTAKKADDTATAANTKASENTGKIDGLQTRTNDLANTNSQQQGVLNTLQQQTPPPPPSKGQ